MVPILCPIVVAVSVSGHEVGGDPVLWDSLGVVVQPVDKGVDTAVQHCSHVQKVLHYRWNFPGGYFINGVPAPENLFQKKIYI